MHTPKINSVRGFNFLFASSLLIMFILTINVNSGTVFSVTETPQVPKNGDADDPAIWINESNPGNSLVFGTDKYNGIYTYNLRGEVIHFSNSGNINNIDIRKTENKSEEQITLLFGSNRSDNSLSLWIMKDSKINLDLEANLFKLSEKPSLKANANMIVYGVCAGRHPHFGDIAFITEDKGSKVQLWSFDGKRLVMLKEFSNSNATQSEGCVYDDENQTLFISEEQDRGVLRAYSLNKNLNFSNPIVIDNRLGNIVGDPEGIAIFKTSDIDGYIVLSSQGDSKFNVYNRKSPYSYVTSFAVGANDSIDAVTDTDGIDISTISINSFFPSGIVVVQDGFNEGDQIENTQNFKFISAKEVLKAINIK